MGGTFYSSTARETRASFRGYSKKSAEELFTQIKERRIHDTMNPKNIKIREARDSEAHPNSFPIILALDVTGSMRHIPLYFLREGLPKLISKIIQSGVPDPALLLIAIGDSECDKAPLQVGQFESGDAELDMWLERLWPEGGGGMNAGESYLLAWHFAAKRTVTDSMEKRNKKGILITIGDEPCLRSVTNRELKEVYGDSGEQANLLTDDQLLKEASKLYDVYHLHIMEGSAGPSSINYWKDLMDQNCIAVDDHTTAPDLIADLVLLKHGIAHGASISAVPAPSPETEDMVL